MRENPKSSEANKREKSKRNLGKVGKMFIHFVVVDFQKSFGVIWNTEFTVVSNVDVMDYQRFTFEFRGRSALNGEIE